MLKSNKIKKVYFGILVDEELRLGMKKLAYKNESSILDYLTEVYEQLISGDIKLRKEVK